MPLRVNRAALASLVCLALSGCGASAGPSAPPPAPAASPSPVPPATPITARRIPPAPVIKLDSVAPNPVRAGETLTVRGSGFSGHETTMVWGFADKRRALRLWEGEPADDGRISFTVPKRAPECGGEPSILYCSPIHWKDCPDVPVDGKYEISVNRALAGRDTCSNAMPANIVGTRTPPWIDSIGPNPVRIGQTVEIRGIGFSGDAIVIADSGKNRCWSFILRQPKRSHENLIRFRIPPTAAYSCGEFATTGEPLANHVPADFRIVVKVWGPHRGISNPVGLRVLPTEKRP